MTSHLSRRTLMTGLCGAATLPALGAAAGKAVAQQAVSLRAAYHLTPPSGWLSDPQRPAVTPAGHQLYYLHSDRNNAPGWWQRASSPDGLTFADGGTAIPLEPNFPVWTGSSVIDTENTAGFGAGAIVVLATRPSGGDRFRQEQYLYFSTDGGVSFTAYGAPVIPNPDGSDWFRDPKIHWDAHRGEWVVVIGRPQSFWFATSPDLIHWTYRSSFGYADPNIGGFECPDLFELTADDGTSHWVLGGSTQGDYTGRPDTYAYWTGSWDGATFRPDSRDPQWLDWGWDWYAGVTWPDPGSPTTRRFGLAWMNNWHYAARTVPTDVSDGYNGQMSITRELRLARQPGGWYTLLSRPHPALARRAKRTVVLPDQNVDGAKVLEFASDAYQLDLEISWSDAANVGLSVGRSADGSRHTNIGVYAGSVYVDRRPSDRADYSFGTYGQSEAPIDPTARSVRLTVLVDRQSVEVFVGAGFTVLSHQVFFRPGDNGLSLYTDGGAARFSGIVVRDFA
ncbi:glycoside hydrolase family 32 protein [Flexivirga sp. ID2601S]|uniref:Glycoside hydrolase family 32 protein n=1 Tax=Flexivirga aerilata TaxID=1656889 RepID=A0A849AQ20_9MICO|nr:glycoside hydrolase family 32 protein [Flexivirga aerilata]NNG40400.1 glycoside hydrolase family 32 protein [Flexivirga aerilata]